MVNWVGLKLTMLTDMYVPFFFTHIKSGLEQFQRFLPALCQCTSADGGVDANGILSPCVAMMAMAIMGRVELT